MPSYIVTSDSPITAKAVDDPEVLPPRPGLPGRPEFPERPGHGLPPSLPPKDEWPELPPLPRPPEGWERPDWKPEHPWVPVEPPGPGEPDPPGIWPPLRPEFPGLPDMTGKTFVLALLYVSRHAPVYKWILVDHDEAKSKLEKLKQYVKDHWPAGGVGRPPQRPGPG